RSYLHCHPPSHNLPNIMSDFVLGRVANQPVVPGEVDLRRCPLSNGSYLHWLAADLSFGYRPNRRPSRLGQLSFHQVTGTRPRPRTRRHSVQRRTQRRSAQSSAKARNSVLNDKALERGRGCIRIESVRGSPHRDDACLSCNVHQGVTAHIVPTKTNLRAVAHQLVESRAAGRAQRAADKGWGNNGTISTDGHFG